MKSALEGDANLRARREVSGEETSLVDQAIPRLGESAVLQMLKDKGLAPDTLETMSSDLLRYNDKARAAVLDMAREQASTSPDAWQGIDLTDEGVQKRVNERLKAEWSDYEATLSMMPRFRGVAEFLGGMAGVTLDIKNAPFLLVGGGSGSFLKVMGREAFLNSTAELATLPSRFEMAERLDIPDPNIAQVVTEAAIGGAVFGGVFEAASRFARPLARGVRYYLGRNELPAVAAPEIDAVSHGQAISAAEDAILAGDNPLEAVMQIVESAPPARGPERPPIVPEKQPQPEAITTETLPPMPGDEDISDGELAAMAEQAIAEPMTWEETVRLAEQELSDIDADRRSNVNRSFARMIKNAGGVHPDSPIAQELRHAGFNHKTMPGLFNRKGAMDLDNIVAREADQAIPGLSSVTGVEGDYLSRQGALDALVRELRGERLETFREMELRSRETAALDALRGPSAIDEFIAGTRLDDGGLHFDPGLGFDDIARAFDDWLPEAWPDIELLPRERREIIDTLRRDGGDAYFLVEGALSREIDADEAAVLKRGKTDEKPAIPFGNEDEAFGGLARTEPEASGRAVATDGDPREPGAGEAGAGSGDFPTERTAIGEQFVIPGAERVSAKAGEVQRQKAALEVMRQQSKMRRGGQSRVEDDPSSMFHSGTLDMFSDPLDPKARALQDGIAADLRDKIEADGDFTVNLDDGRGARGASHILDELDADDDFLAILDACGKPKVNA